MIKQQTDGGGFPVRNKSRSGQGYKEGGGFSDERQTEKIKAQARPSDHDRCRAVFYHNVCCSGVFHVFRCAERLYQSAE